MARLIIRFGILACLAAPFSISALEQRSLPGSWNDALTTANLPDGSILVAQRSGLIDRLAPDGSEFSDPVLWADVGGGDARLLGLAVDPDYLSSGYVFAALSTMRNGQMVTRLTRWRDAGNGLILNRVLVDELPSGAERAGGVLKVGPDGKLWLGLGDGAASAADVTPAQLRGVLLRYNEDGSIPKDNPDPKSPVWAWGFRDPSGLAWQPDSGRLYALDRGPAIPRGTMDRLDLIEKGSNYGWPKYIGRDRAAGVVRPIIYCSSGHSWVPGGAVFATEGEWKGSLLFAGAGEGNLYRLSLDVKNPEKILFYEELINGSLGALVDVAVGPQGQMLLLSNKKLYVLTP
jgi:glucose/arabinose dehydrogenase